MFFMWICNLQTVNKGRHWHHWFVISWRPQSPHVVWLLLKWKVLKRYIYRDWKWVDFILNALWLNIAMFKIQVLWIHEKFNLCKNIHQMSAFPWGLFLLENTFPPRISWSDSCSYSHLLVHIPPTAVTASLPCVEKWGWGNNIF
jgi:hypothetical protein